MRVANLIVAILMPSVLAACGVDVINATTTDDSPLEGGTSATTLPDGAPAPSDAGTDSATNNPPALDGGDAGDGGLAKATLTVTLVTTVGATTNLTTEGTIDWVHWGMNAYHAINRKQGGSGISDYVVTGNPVYGDWYNASPTTFTWTGGTPTSSASTKTYDWLGGNTTTTATITINASPTPRTAAIYVGVYWARARLEATMTDDPTVQFSDESVEKTNSANIVQYTAVFSSPTPNAKLQLRWRPTQLYAIDGAIRVAAVTLH